jgi:hypothetical protein
MSGGSKTTTNSHQTTTPQAPTWFAQPYQNYMSDVSQLRGVSPQQLMTPATATQTQGFGRALAGTPGISSDLTGYQGGEIATTDLNPYLNQGLGALVNSTMNDWAHGNDLALNSLKAATPSGAFGGTRQDVAKANLLAENSRTLGSLLSNLNYQNYGNAQTMAQNDITNRLNAANLRMSAQGANADNMRADTNLMLTAGDQERAIAASNNPYLTQANWLGVQGGLLGQVPASAFVGSDTQGTQTQSTSGGNMLGSLLGAASLFVPGGQGYGLTKMFL